jgi:alkanesulfonate monooxygenase SsuD/methylene tetrahydromethanopterin reductase-like flavin-dependent oxidoreductase (luciferase family)
MIPGHDVLSAIAIEYGAHLPLIDFGGGPCTLAGLRTYAARAVSLGYTTLCANDHLLFARPWLDGPTALAAVLEESADVALATTVCLPVIRGPAQTAKTMATLDLLSGGRLLIGMSAGSSARDYAVAGIDFEERWPRFEEAAQALRALLHADAVDFEGTYYSTRDVVLEPRPAQDPGPPIWIGGWGSRPGLRRIARLADGWLASAYNTTPDAFRDGLAYLTAQLDGTGREPAGFPNGLATAWLYVTDDRAAAERALADVLSPMLNRPLEQLQQLSLPIGPAEVCAERLAAFADAGLQRAFVWPLGDELRQLELFSERVAPLVPGST